MPVMTTDVLIIGSGLGATALARSLSKTGVQVILLTGVGCSRSPHLDGGVVDPELVNAAFGPGAPLGRLIAGSQTLTMESREQFAHGPVEGSKPRATYRRSSLETWAMDRAVSAGALYLDDLIEGKALPNGDGSMTLTSERDDRTIRANLIILCEGADPRIPMRVKLRPDYAPEDQLHFARTVIRGAHLDDSVQGNWRTSWGMPVQFRVMPLVDGVMVSVVARIENIMRSSRSSAEALEDLLSSAAFAALGIDGEREGTGMELVALRPRRGTLPFVHDRLAMGIDASGVIDPRRPDRADLTIRSGLHLASVLLANRRSVDDWPDAAGQFVRRSIPEPGAYHDDRATGYIEEGLAGGRESFVARVGGLIRRGR